MNYLRLTWSDVWHFHEHCQHYRRIKWYHPGRLITRKSKPKTGEFCNECLAKRRRDDRLSK